MTYNKKDPAFPCMPIQDQFNRLVAPIPGMTKYEYVLLKMYSNILSNPGAGFGNRDTIKHALLATDLYFEHLKNLENEKETTATIIQ